MEVAVADMANHRAQQSLLVNVLLGGSDHLGQGRDGDTDIRCDGPTASPDINTKSSWIFRSFQEIYLLIVVLLDFKFESISGWKQV